MALDQYANISTITVVESAANTLTFAELLTGAGFGTGRGMIIDEIDYYIPFATEALIVAGGDGLEMGIALSNNVSDLEDVGGDNRVLHSVNLSLKVLTAVGFSVVESPRKFQFFPPLIHGQPKLFFGVQGVALASAATIHVRVYWRYVDLDDKTILEIAETFAVV